MSSSSTSTVTLTPTSTSTSSSLRWLVVATHVDETGAGGGMVRYTVELIRKLNESPGIELHVVCTKAGRTFFGSSLGMSSSQLHTLPTSSTLALSLMERYALHPLFHKRWDVVHGVKHLLPKYPRAFVRVLTVHDTILLDRPEDFGWAKRTLLKRHYLDSIDEADCVVSVSQATADRLQARVRSSVGKTRVVRLVGAGTLDHITASPVDALTGKRFALVVGDPSPRKNLRLLASIWPEVRAAVPDAVLAIVGPRGWGTVAGTEEIGELVSAGSAVELGHISNAELRWAYENAAVTLCPSLLEGFGLPVAEARRAGSPVISSSDPAQIEAATTLDGYGGAGSFVHISVEEPALWASKVIEHFSCASLAGHRVARDTVETSSVHHERTWSDVDRDTVEASCVRHERTWSDVARETTEHVRRCLAATKPQHPASMNPAPRTEDDKTISIVQANKAYAPRIGGVETVIRDIAVGLAQRGVTSTVIAAGEGSASGSNMEDGVRVRRSRTLLRARSVPFAPSMIRSLRTEPGDALLIHEPSVMTMLAYTLARRTPHRRIVVWWHFDVTRQKVLWVLVRRLMHRLLDRADAIITATPHHVSSSEVLSRYADKIAFIPFGIDLDRWRGLGATPCPVRTDEPFVLFVGRLVYYKGIPEFLQVVEGLPTTRFVVVGSGPLEQLVREHEACKSGRLELLGHLSDAELASVMKAARVFAFSSATETEAFGIVQSQAMALGTPVVGFDLPTGTTWVNKHDVSGVVVPLGDCNAFTDAVDKLVHDDEHHARLSAGAYQRADDEFDFDVYIDRVLSVLHPA